MSEEADYYVSQSAYSSFSYRDVQRIAEQRRDETEIYMQRQFYREISNLRNSMNRSVADVRGEIRGISNDIRRCNQQLDKKIQCETKLREALSNKLEQMNKDAQEERTAVKKALDVIDGNINHLQDRLTHQQTMIKDVETYARTIESRLEKEIQDREQEKFLQAQDVNAMLRTAQNFLQTSAMPDLAEMGLKTRWERVSHRLTEAGQLATKPHQSQATVAILSDIADEGKSVYRDYLERRAESDRLIHTVRLNLERIRFQLEELKKDNDVMYFFKRSVEKMQKQLESAENSKSDIEKDAEQDFSRKLARYDHLAKEVVTLDDALADFYSNKELTLQKARQRNEIVRTVLESLVEVWGVTFETDYRYLDANDPTAPLMLQTKRPHHSNVTLQIDLDGRMQASFTGYVGMECVRDVSEFQKKLSSKPSLHVEIGVVKEKPDAPNPSGIDGGSGPVIYKPSLKKEQKAEKVR